MAKSKSKLHLPEGVSGLNPIKKIRPTGNLLLVERIDESELTSTILMVEQGKLSNQAYIVDIGPLVNKDYGFTVGMRVMLQGSFTPVPILPGDSRERAVVLPDMIKAILEE